MTEIEREQWGDRLIAATIEDDEAVGEILDRVEALEAELATASARIAEVLRKDWDIQGQLRDAYLEGVAAGKTETPRPSHVVHTTGGHWHAFERGVDVFLWMQDKHEVSPSPYLVHSWTWHPSTPAKEDDTND